MQRIGGKASLLSSSVSSPAGQWTEGRRTVPYWDGDGFTSGEGVAEPWRVLHTLETVQRRERTVVVPWQRPLLATLTCQLRLSWGFPPLRAIPGPLPPLENAPLRSS
jgi:hypothetical protein